MRGVDPQQRHANVGKNLQPSATIRAAITLRPMHLWQSSTRPRPICLSYLTHPRVSFFVGESGTELLFRLIRAAIVATSAYTVFSNTVEHPATRSVAAKWSAMMGKSHIYIAHDDATGAVDAHAYAAQVKPDAQFVTILHTLMSDNHLGRCRQTV